MRAIYKIIIFCLTITGVVIVINSCQKDTSCPAVITVKMQSDTNTVVPNATVTIHKGDIVETGVSDVNGQFRYTFKLEAILDVDAKVPAAPPDTLYGQTVIRLVPGKTAYKSVFVN